MRASSTLETALNTLIDDAVAYYARRLLVE